jgi:phosphopantothenate---cysteine ligase (CTP)
MRCIVTAGPTYETMDNVRRLTNFSTGRLGTELANYLTSHGHHVTLLIGELATHSGEKRAWRIETFTTTSDLESKLKALAVDSVTAEAVFHVAAVSDFKFGKIWFRDASGELKEIQSGKISTDCGPLMAELVPTPKIISELRRMFPKAKLAGWKFEVDGDPARVIAAAQKQVRECRTNISIANGPAYGTGFGVVTGDGKCIHVPDIVALLEALEKFLRG